MAAPKKLTEKVRFYAYDRFNRPVNPYLIVSSDTYKDPTTRRLEIDPMSIKDVQFNFGHFETGDQETIDFLDRHNSENPNGSNITREFLQELKEGETLVEKVVEKRVLPLALAEMLEQKTLKAVLLNEYGFETDATEIKEIIEAATAAGIIVK